MARELRGGGALWGLKWKGRRATLLRRVVHANESAFLRAHRLVSIIKLKD